MMADITVICFLLTIVSNLSLICGSEVPWVHAEEFPTSSTGFPPVSDNRSSSETEEINDAELSHADEMSRTMENYLLRMLKLSSRPPPRVAESLVPGYVRALQRAIDSIPPSTNSADDDLTWAIKAQQGGKSRNKNSQCGITAEIGIQYALPHSIVGVTAQTNVTTVHFDMANKFHDSFPWRAELVFESPLVSTQAGVQRGRARVDVCRVTGAGTTACHRWKTVRYRQYDGHGRSYTVYDVTSAVAPLWPFCYPKPCRLELRVHGAGRVRAEGASTILVVYQNMIPNVRSDVVRATRRALRSGWSSQQVAPPTKQSRDERYRRGVRNNGRENDGYCRLYKWLVDFRALNWTWVVAPHTFEAGYCAGRCPSHNGDLERVNLTNHAFMRMLHRAWTMNIDGGRLPAPSCVSVRYSPLSMLYRTNEDTFELRHVNEMISTACGCL